MWYNSFRHLVKRSNRIHIQKKLLVLLQEAQLIYVVNFLYIFSPDFSSLLSSFPFLLHCIKKFWCACSNIHWWGVSAVMPALTSQQWKPAMCAVLLQLPPEPPWESPHPGVLSNHTPSAPVSPGRQRSPSHLLRTESSTNESSPRIRDKDAFATNVLPQALASVPARVPVLPENSGLGWADRSAKQGNSGTSEFPTITQVWESGAWKNSVTCHSNPGVATGGTWPASGVKCFFLTRRQRTGSPAVFLHWFHPFIPVENLLLPLFL